MARENRLAVNDMLVYDITSEQKGVIVRQSLQHRFRSIVFQDGPPNLDEIFKNLFGGQSKAKQAFKKPGDPNAVTFQINIKLLFVLFFAIWALSGFLIVKPAQKATVLRFGRYQQTLERGLHWVPPIVSSVYVLDVNKIHSFKHTAEMLTKDENIVDVSVAVWYRIRDPKQFLFNVANPSLSLKEATASALRQVIGHTELDQILTKGRNKVMEDTKQQLLRILHRYQTGIEVTELNLLPAKPPEAVTAAFDDAIKAREDEQRYINQARAYAEKVEPIAIGQAARIVRQATADAQQIVMKSQADVAPFVALLPAHRAQPDLTNTRLYFTTMANILSHVRKIITNGSGRTNLFLTPTTNNTIPMSHAAAMEPNDIPPSAQPKATTRVNISAIPPRHESVSSSRRSNYAFIAPKSERRQGASQ